MKPSESAQGLTVIWVVDVFNEKMLVEGMSRVLNEINFRTIYSKDFCLLHQNKQIRLISNHGWALKTLIHIGYIHYGVGTKTIVNWSKGMIQVSRLSQISSKGIILSVKLGTFLVEKSHIEKFTHHYLEKLFQIDVYMVKIDSHRDNSCIWPQKIISKFRFSYLIHIANVWWKVMRDN